MCKYLQYNAPIPVRKNCLFKRIVLDYDKGYSTYSLLYTFHITRYYVVRIAV
jgi:hypothetical protein